MADIGTVSPVRGLGIFTCTGELYSHASVFPILNVQLYNGSGPSAGGVPRRVILNVFLTEGFIEKLSYLDDLKPSAPMVCSKIAKA